MKTELRENQIILVGLVFAFFIFFFIVIFVESYSEQGTRDEVYFWIKLVTGASWPEEKFSGHPALPLVAASASLNVLLSFGPFLGIVFLWFKILTREDNAMQLAESLIFRDGPLEAKILKRVFEDLPNDKKEQFENDLRDLFNQATDDWQKHLAIVLGQERARKLLKNMERLDA